MITLPEIDSEYNRLRKELEAADNEISNDLIPLCKKALSTTINDGNKQQRTAQIEGIVSNLDNTCKRIREYVVMLTVAYTNWTADFIYDPVEVERSVKFFSDSTKNLLTKHKEYMDRLSAILNAMTMISRL